MRVSQVGCAKWTVAHVANRAATMGLLGGFCARCDSDVIFCDSCTRWTWEYGAMHNWRERMLFLDGKESSAMLARG